MSPQAEALLRHAINTGALLGALLAFAFSGQETLSHVALGGLLTYLVPVAAPTIPRPIVAAAAMLAVIVTLPGCGGSFPQTATLVVDGLKWTCIGAAKLCDALDPELHDAACRVVHTTCSIVNSAPTPGE